MRLGDATRMRVETISGGTCTWFGTRGGRFTPKGRVIEIYGPESSGKTTLALHTIVSAEGGGAAFLMLAGTPDPTYAAALGVDITNLLIANPDTGETALELSIKMVRSVTIDIN